MNKSSLLALSMLALGLSACFDDSGTSSSPYNDVKASDLTPGDRVFLSTLAANGAGFGALNKSSERMEKSTSEPMAFRKLSSFLPDCSSPQITHDVFWELGDSTYEDSLHGGRKIVIDDTTTIYDFATGADVTCSDSSMGNGKTRQVFRQAMQEGELLTTSMGGTFVVDSKFDFNDLSSWEMEITLTMKGKVFYTNGFTLDVDTAYAHDKFSLANPDGTSEEAYYHVNFVGYAYSSGMRYDKASDALVGDVVRGSERIGTMKVFEDDRMEVRDLDGKLIAP